jgi:Carboxypeptidase regulatory-like domain
MFMLTKIGLTSRLGLFRNGGAQRFAAVQILLTCAVLAFLANPLRAQLYTATLTGTVTDPSGAVIPGASVTLTNVGKGFSSSTTTGASGAYTIRSLQPGDYGLRVEAKGFKTYVQQDITLAVAQSASVNVTMELGSPVQTVSVTGASPVLATQDAVTGQEVNRTFINDLPLIGRGVFDLAFLSPGVNPTAGGAFSGSQNDNNFVSNGARNMSADVLVDGVTVTSHSDDSQQREVEYVPSIDAVQEFKVQQNNFSADTGFSGSTVLNVVMRSGTNQFHGTVYEFVRNQKFDANNWFNNSAGIDIPPLRYNDFGFVVGGPIRKNKTFFFGDYEGSRIHSLSAFSAGVPSALERQGDFGELCGYAGGDFDSSGQCTEPDGQLWDPYSGVYDDNEGGPVRSTFIPFNNMATYQSAGSPALAGTPYQLPAVPGNIIDPVAYKIMQYYPMPNYKVGTSEYDPYTNWRGTGANVSNNDQFDIRVDQHIGNNTLLTTRFSRGWNSGHSPNCFGNALDPCSGGENHSPAINAVVNLTHSFGPNTVMAVSYGYVRGGWGGPGLAGDFPNFSIVSDLGMPAYMQASGAPATPTLEIYGGYSMAGSDSIGQQGWSIANVRHEAHDLLASLDHMQGRHEIKFGGEMRMERNNYYDPGAPAGNFAYDFTGTSGTPESGTGGDALATFLTGTDFGGWGEYEVPIRPATQSFFYAGYLQDNWRATSKLTVNLGLRYSVEFPRTERFNRQEWFDPNISLPLTVPGMPNLKGGEVFVTPSNRSIANVNYSNIQPRFGLAYRLTPKTVLRAGYGIFYSTFNFGPTGDVNYGFDGFTETTNWLPTYQNDGATPFGWLHDPWPGGGPHLPTGTSLGPLTHLGGTASGAIRTWNNTPYMQTWSLGFQHELPGNIVVDANYIGTKGTHLLYGGFGNLNHLGPWVEKATPDQISALNTYVDNPFYGIVTDLTSPLSPDSVPQSQLLVPYPQFSSTSVMEPPWANSIYHAAQFRVEKRFANGLQFLVNYTISKSIDDASAQGDNVTWTGGFTHLQDPNNLKLERGLSEFDIPQVLTFAYVYQLPFGRGKRWGGKWNKWVDGFLGGWRTNGVWRYDNGQPVYLSLSGGGQPLPTYGSQRPNLLAPLQANPRSKWFCSDSDCGYFSNPDVAQVPDPFTIGTGPPVLPNVRVPGAQNASLSLFKEFSLNPLREGSRLEFRLETFNAFNHPQFGGINASVDSGDFGVVGSQANSPREVQLGLKLYW